LKKQLFKGVGTALVTPFKPDGSVDFAAFEGLIEMQLEAGINALIICGTTGETPTLSDKEFSELLRRAVLKVKGRVPVIAGTGRNDTAHSAELCREAELLGADGLLMVTPYYNKTTQKGLLRHYFTCADASDLPIILYSVPSRTGMTISPETQAKLAEHPNIVGIKDASGDFSAILRARSLCPEDFSLYSGNDDQIVPILSLGGAGVISVLSNIIPAETVKICYDFFEGHADSAASAQIKYAPLISALFSEVNPVPVKTALWIMGKCGRTLRPPLYEMDPGACEVLVSRLHQYNIPIEIS